MRTEKAQNFYRGNFDLGQSRQKLDDTTHFVEIPWYFFKHQQNLEIYDLG